MSCGCQDTGAQLCGCCAGVTQETPATIANRPDLPALAYRVGTYASFLATMEAALSGSNVPALAGLRTRSNGDFSIALVDAWSEVLDILTFYTERLANEAYLGTAIEARSVFELARLVGYKPSPGVSASTVLAFTLATAPGSPTIVPIPAGTRVQSVPGPGQTMQVFETSSDLTATIAANAIPAATTQPWQLFGGDTSTWVTGTSNNIQVGNVLLFLSATQGVPSIGGPAAVGYVTSVQIDPVGKNTLVSWDQPLPSALTAADSSALCLYVFRTKAALFGAASPVPGLFASSVIGTIPGSPSTVTSSSDWAWQYAGNQTINLDNSYPGLNPAASGANAAASLSQWMVLATGQSASFFQIQSVSESNPGLYALSAKTTQLTLASGSALPGDGDASTGSDLDTILTSFVNNTRTTTAYVQSQLLTLANLPLTQWTLNPPYVLATGMIVPVQGAGLVLAALQPFADNSPVGVSGKRVRIAPSVALTGTNGGFTPAGATGSLAVSINQPFLVDAFPPTPDPQINSNLLWSVITVTGQAGTMSVPAGSFVLQPSVSTDPTAGEAAMVTTATVNGATTSLALKVPLARIYDTPTVTVNANTVEATHGETMKEILGSGDATNAALEFQLKQSPLTYTSASTPGGVQSTLQVRVNNLLWNEVSDFLSSAQKDRVYVTRPSSSAGAMVQFGDGVHGARTPTGKSNIQAQYRKGIGLAGMVAAGQLTQPLDRPQGLQSVSNPGAATGGADPAGPADAKLSAPLPTLTLGRVVSLEDYQNFALGFAGIAMALASWTWFGYTRGIFLTLAGEGGTQLDANDQVVQNLMLAYQTYGLPYVPVMPVSYVPALFEIGMQVKIDTPTYVPDLVISQVWQALAAAFAFGNTTPGQSVSASQVIQIAQQIPGVIAVNLIGLCRSGDSGANNLVCANGPNPTANPPSGAEVLLLDPASQGNVEVWS